MCRGQSSSYIRPPQTTSWGQGSIPSRAEANEKGLADAWGMWAPPGLAPQPECPRSVRGTPRCQVPSLDTLPAGHLHQRCREKSIACFGELQKMPGTRRMLETGG